MTGKKFFALIMAFILIFVSVSDAKLISNKTRKKWGKQVGKIVDKVFTQENVDRGVDAVAHYVENKGRSAPQTNVYVNNPPAQQVQQVQQVETQSPIYKTSTTDFPPEELARSFKTLAKKIITNNQPAYQIQLKKNELPKNSKHTVYNRVCAKDKTIVAGSAGKSGKFKAFCMMTTDPAFIFTGGIRD